MNFLDELPNPYIDVVFEGFKKTIYFFLTKIMNAILAFIDSIVSLFNFFSGTGSEEGLLTSIFKNSAISKAYINISLIAFILMLLFAVITIIKQDYFDHETPKSKAPIIKNMILGFFLFLVIVPATSLILRLVSIITGGLYGVISGSDPTSITEILKAPFVDFESSIEIIEPGGQPIFFVLLVGALFVGWNLLYMVMDLIKRIFNIIILFVMAPFDIAYIVSDDGVRFKKWKDKALSQIVSIVGIIASFSVFGIVVSLIGNMQIVSAGGDTTVTTLLRDNYLFMIILLMGGSLVIKDTSKMISELSGGNNIFKSSVTQNLSSYYNENKVFDGGKNIAKADPQTILKTKTQTGKRTVSFTQRGNKKTISTTGTSKTGVNYPGVAPNTGNMPGVNDTSSGIRVNKKTNNNKLQERINIGSGTNYPRIDGHVSGKYNNDNNNSIGAILNKGFDMSKNNASLSLDKSNEDYSVKTTNVDYDNVSRDFAKKISSSGSTQGVSNIVLQYVDVANKEKNSIQKEMKQKSNDIAPLKKDFSDSQKVKYESVSSNYKKAQSDYSKTTSKIQTLASTPGVNSSDIVRMKEKADRQRQTLMNASNKASSFYKETKGGN